MKNCLSCDHYSDSYGRCRKGYSPGSCERELAIDEDYSKMIRSEMEKKKEKKLTNGDRIRQMTDEELARFLEITCGCSVCFLDATAGECTGFRSSMDCIVNKMKWLKQEVSTNDDKG